MSLYVTDIFNLRNHVKNVFFAAEKVWNYIKHRLNKMNMLWRHSLVFKYEIKRS